MNKEVEADRGWIDGFWGRDPQQPGCGKAKDPIYWKEYRRGAEMRDFLEKEARQRHGVDEGRNRS